MVNPAVGVRRCLEAEDRVSHEVARHGRRACRITTSPKRIRPRPGRGAQTGSMELEDRDPETLTVADFFAFLVGDDEAAAAREHFCDVVAAQLRDVASWLGLDAWLGAGDVQDTLSQERPNPTTRVQSFVAIGLVAQISAELVSGAQILFRNANEYGASALVRQLIECEYLLRAFRLDFTEAARWFEATGKERWDFSPAKLRKIGGFDDKEYSDHCESGGHPHRKGSLLLQLPRGIDDLQRAVAGASRDLDPTRGLWLDFAFHCDRTWRALTDLLCAEHARFERVRAERLTAVVEARSAWLEADILAEHAGPVLEALKADPATLLSDLVDLDGGAEEAEHDLPENELPPSPSG